jgi:hypothetical protein
MGGSVSLQQTGWGQVGVYFVGITADGKLSPPVAAPRIPSSSNHPFVSAGTAGRVFVVWTGAKDNNQTVFMSTTATIRFTRFKSCGRTPESQSLKK